MTRTTRWSQGILFAAALAGRGAVAQQQPVQFKADVRMQSGSDGSKSAGIMYFGGAKVRTELTMDGQSIIVLADPRARSQYVLMPSEKVYMQMPIGEGPVSVPIAGPSDPTNPCSGDGGATDCVKGPIEPVNSYEAVRWDYTAKDGTRTRAWISTKFRFPVKIEDDNGGRMELSNIAVGAQAASLFAIPAGYTKMDVGAMGGMGAGRGRGEAGLGNSVAAAMSNMSPEAAAAMAAAMRGQAPGGRGSRETPGPTGSAWEQGKGWILSVTVTATRSSDRSGEGGTLHETYTARYVASIPLNYGSPAVGVPGAPGPMWTHMAAEGMGSPEALAKPLTLSVETEAKSDGGYKGACGIDEEPYTSVGLMKGSGQNSVAINRQNLEMRGQAVFKLSGDLKTYDLLAGVGMVKGKEVTDIKLDLKSCKDGHAYTKNKSDTQEVSYALPSIEIKGLPTPATVSPISGSKKMRLNFGARGELDANVSWTLTPIR